jgi:hypothetical protein
MTRSKKSRSQSGQLHNGYKRRQRRLGKQLVIRRSQPIVSHPMHHTYPPSSVEFSPILITKNSILLSNKKGKAPFAEKDIDAVYLRKFFSSSYVFWLLSFWASFIAPLFVPHSKLSKTNSRGTYDCVCFGIHQQVGHQSIHWTRASKYENGFALRQLLRLYGWVFDRIGEQVRKMYPTIAAQLTVRIPKEYLLFGGLFTYAMFHLTPMELEHIDYNDFGICVVVPLGSAFTGGHLRFNYLNIEYVLQPGDMIIFRSARLLHSVTQVVSGLRQSLVLTSQTSVLRKIKEGCVPL